MPQETITPTDGLEIKESVTFEPGVYVLPAGLTVAKDEIEIDGNGATLVGVNREGVGLSLQDLKKVTIKNLRIRDYHTGIKAVECEKVRLEHNQITSTAEIEDNTIFLDIWTPADEAYGAAITLIDCEKCTVSDNLIAHQMNGLQTYNCKKLTVTRNNANFNSGFGIHLNNTSDSEFSHNWCDYCCRWQPRDIDDDHPHGKVGQGGYGHMGADATGFLIINKSCKNHFYRNFARLGGDGFFLAGRNPQGEDVNCADNLFEENDGSLSPNIAFEATFSTGNVFRNNWADRCNYGFWLGYSKENVLEGNRMLYNRQAGIAVEHGANFTVKGNDFQSNGHGILIWTRYIEQFQTAGDDNKTSHDWTIEENKLFKNHVGIGIYADRDHGIRPAEPENAGKPELRPRDHQIRNNDIQDNRVGIWLHKADNTVIEQNKLSANVEANFRHEDDSGTEFARTNLGWAGAYL